MNHAALRDVSRRLTKADDRLKWTWFLCGFRNPDADPDGYKQAIDRHTKAVHSIERLALKLQRAIYGPTKKAGKKK